MKKILLILSIFCLASCGYFRENYREVNFKLEDGKTMNLIMFESNLPLNDRTLVVYGNDYALKGKDCEDSELKDFSKNLWKQISQQNDLSHLKVGAIFLLQKQTESNPTYCNYRYTKDSNGEWKMN